MKVQIPAPSPPFLGRSLSFSAYNPSFSIQSSGIPEYIAMLGSKTAINSKTGFILMNQPLIEFLVSKREAVIQPLYRVLSTSMDLPQILEGLYLGQRLAESGTSGVKLLYAAASRFNNTSNPLIQIYLSGFYRSINVPDSFGPLLEMFMRRVKDPVWPEAYRNFDPVEELGGTLLQQIASFSARETLKALKKGTYNQTG